MIKFGPKYSKLKISLQLASARLKLLQAKKRELSEKLKAEVANYMKSGKHMQAKLKAQKIIKDEASLEAMELMEMHCEDILERYDLFQQTKRPDNSLITPISSLIWVAPYYQTHVEELKEVSKQFSVKYGNYFCRMALRNQTETVNPELIERVRMFMPTDEKIENCLQKICAKYNIFYKYSKDEDTKAKFDDNSRNSEELNQEKEDGSSSKKTEFQAEGISKIDSTVSSKKVFKDIMFKSKILKGAKTNSDDAKEKTSCNEDDSGSNVSLLSDLQQPGNQQKNTKCPALSSDECGESFLKYKNKEINIPDNNTQDNNTQASFIPKSDIYFDLKEPGNPQVNTNCPDLNLDECGESLLKYKIKEEIDKNEENNTLLSFIPDINFDRYHCIYADPPPPYDDVYFNEASIAVHAKPGTIYANFDSFQLPTCPTEDPDSQSSNENTDTEKEGK